MTGHSRRAEAGSLEPLGRVAGRVCGVCTLLVFTLVTAGAFARAQQVDAPLEQARTEVATDPASADAHYRLARLLLARNAPAESLKVFTEAAALRHPSGEDLRLVALDYVLLKDTASARYWLRKSVALDPRNVESWYDLARNEMSIGDFGSAEKAIRHALELDPKLVKAENNLGLILEALNRPDEAEQAYRHAVEWQAGEAHPSAQPLMNGGLLLISRGRANEGLPMLEQAALLSPDNPQVLAGLGKARADTGDLTGAAEAMKRAAKLDETNPRLHFQLGQLYRQLGDTKDAAAELRRSQELYGQHSSEPEPGK